MDNDVNVNITKEIKEDQPQAAPAELAPETVKKQGWFVRFVPYLADFMPYVLNIVITLGIVWGYDQFYAQKVVAFDLKGFIAQQRDGYITGAITPDQFRANLDKLEVAMLSEPPNHVMIMGDAVIRNARIINVAVDQGTSPAKTQQVLPAQQSQSVPQ